MACVRRNKPGAQSAGNAHRFPVQDGGNEGCPADPLPHAASNRQAVFSSTMMQIRVLPFGVLKDWLGSSAATVELPEGATVAELLERLSTGQAAPQPAHLLRGIAVSVNDEFASATQVLRAGDEVGLLPPVSGGVARAAGGGDGQSEDRQAAALTREPIDAERLIAAAKSREDGAVVVFDGIVRNNSRGRQTLYLDYEAHDQLAVKQMKALVEEALERFGIRDAFIVHRLGRLQVGETSVLIVVAAAP